MNFMYIFARKFFPTQAFTFSGRENKWGRVGGGGKRDRRVKKIGVLEEKEK